MDYVFYYLFNFILQRTMNKMNLSKTKKETSNVISFQRNGGIITNKFLAFLLPSVLTSAATSLNYFLDSFVVAQTLGSTAMSIINMASPAMFVMSATYSLFGEGGSVVYAYLKGRMDKENAKKILSLTMFVVLAIGLAMAVFGSVFTDEIAAYFSDGTQMQSEFRDYIRFVMASAIIIIPMQTLLMFYAAEGLPQVATAVNVVSNVVNIAFDYILTVWIPLGVTGIALATTIGYMVGLVIILVLYAKPKYKLSFAKFDGRDFRSLKQISEKGLAAFMNQVGFCIKVHFSNQIAIMFAGGIGITIFSTCFQTVSLISIVIGGILHSMTPLISSLYSMKDYNGVRFLMKAVIKMELLVSLAFCAFIEIYPGVILELYNVTAPNALAVGIPALRIFGLMYLFRQTVLVFMYYYQTLGHKAYAMTISTVDGFVGIVVYTAIFSHFWGIEGLWMAYPACSATLLAVILVIGLRMDQITNGKYHGIFMLASTDGIDFSVKKMDSNISKFVENLERNCLARGMESRKAYLTAVACEEICVYYSKTAQSMDIFVLIDDDNAEVHLRCLGEPMDILSAPREELSNVDILMKIAKEVKYDYLMGMNQAVVIIEVVNL